jgi:hypothetical protein
MRGVDRKSQTRNHTNEYENRLNTRRSSGHTQLHAASSNARHTNAIGVRQGEPYSDTNISLSHHHSDKDTKIN